MNPILVSLNNGCLGNGCDLLEVKVLKYADIEKAGSPIEVIVRALDKGTDKEEKKVEFAVYGP